MECGLNLLERHRALAARCEKLAMRHRATLDIAAINQWLPPGL
jgi:hypothetical protein